jgi:CMP-N,N'-diacetyllegionaminic acid synthase
MNILCTICVRKGSKGLKNKNLIKLNNKPLLSRALDQAKNVKIFDKIVVSTDSNEAIKLSKKKNIDIFFKRSNLLAGDKIGKVSVIRDALKRSEKYYKKNFDIIIDLDVSSPLRKDMDIKKALNKFLKEGSSNLITGCIARKNPYFNMIEIKNKTVSLSKNIGKKILSRQLSPKVFDMNASIYIWKRNYLLKTDNLFSKKTSFYEMPFNRSVDIDDQDDLRIVKLFLKNEKK